MGNVSTDFCSIHFGLAFELDAGDDTSCAVVAGSMARFWLGPREIERRVKTSDSPVEMANV